MIFFFDEQVVTVQVIMARANAVAALFIDTTQLTTKALTYCAKTLAETVIKYPALAANDVSVSYVFSALSSILSSSSDLPAGVLANVTSAISALNFARQQTMSVGESPLVLNTPNMGIKTLVSYATSLLSGLTPAITDTQKALGAATSSVSMNTTGISAYSLVAVSLVIYNNNPHTIPSNSTAPNTQSLKLNINFLSGSGSAAYTLVLQNIAPVDYTYYPAINRTYQCELQPSSYYVNANCSGSKLYPLYCPGTSARNLKYTCPAHQMKPSCNVWNGFQYSSAGCKVVSFTPLSTTCSCKFSSAGSRRLASSSSQQSVEFAASSSRANNLFSSGWQTPETQTEPTAFYVSLLKQTLFWFYLLQNFYSGNTFDLLHYYARGHHRFRW